MKNHWILSLLALAILSSSSAQTKDPSASLPAGGTQPAAPYQEQVHARIKQLREELAVNPQDGKIRFTLTQFLFHVKRYKEAIVEGNAALTYFNEHPSLYYMIGESHRQLGQPEDAMKFLDIGYHLKDKEISAALATSYGMTLLRLNRLPEAATVFNGIAKNRPGFIDEHLQTGSLDYKEGRMQDATEEWLAVRLVNPKKLSVDQTNFVDFNYNFRKYAESNNAVEATASFLHHVRAKFGDRLIYDELGSVFQCMIAQKQFDDARALFVTLIQMSAETMKQDSVDVLFFHNINGLTFQCGELRPAATAVFKRTAKSHLKMDDGELAGLFSLYDFTIQQGATSIAADIFSEVLSSASSIQRYTHLADLFAKFNKSDDAVATFKAMLKKGKVDDLGYSNDLASIYSGLLAAKKTQEAEAFMDQLELLNVAELIPTYNSLADIFIRANEGEKAIAILNKILTIDSSNVKASLQLGEAYYAAGKYDEMISSFLSVKGKEGRRYLAMAYEKKYYLAEANQQWQEFISLSDDAEAIGKAKERIRLNTIALMSPDYQALKLAANERAGAFRVVIDSPHEGDQVSAPSITLTGHCAGTAVIQDYRINGQVMEGMRGMKNAQGASADSSIDPQTSFSFPVLLVKGENKFVVEAVSSTGETAAASVTFANLSEGSARPSALTLEQADSIRQNKAYAVIVGIANYESKDIRSLGYTTNDAKELAEVLTNPKYGGFKPENVTLLLDKAATTKNIKKALGTGLRKVPSDGIAVVFFAGHGAPEGSSTYWLTYDTDPNDLYASSLSNNDIAGMLEQINTKCVVTFIDACYSGASIKTSKSARAFLEDPFKSFEGTGQVAITSSDGKQQSLEDEKLRHGIFSYRLIEAIKGKADKNEDGIVTANEVADYIKRTVPNDARERSWKQDPVVKAEYTGDLPISMNPENAMKRSKTKRIALFEGLYDQEKISANELKRIKAIIDTADQKKNKKIVDYLNGDLDLETLLRFVKD